MHVLHLIKTSDGAGWALNFMKELKLNFPQITFSVAVPLGGKYSSEYYSVCKNVYDFQYQINSSLLRRGKTLQEIVLIDKPDIIHSWFVQTTLYARLFLRKFNIPRLFQVVGPLHLENRILKWCDIISTDKNDYWIATSKYIIRKYQNSGVKDHRLFLNYAFVDVLKLIDEKENLTLLDLKKELNIPKHYKIVGTASYIYPPKFYEKIGVKGHDYLLDSFRKLLSDRKDVALIIAGGVFGNGEKYLERLKRIANKIDPNRIFFTGEYSHVYEVLSNFDVFVYLSKSENLGGVFESLLFEVPTISSNRGALPELVIDRITGLTVDIKNTTEVANKIGFLLDSPQPEWVLKGKETVIETSEKVRIIKNGYDIYAKLVSC